MATVIRRFFPSFCECPRCKKRARHPDSSGGRAGLVRYKRCIGCHRSFPVVAIAEEIDDGGAWSRVRGL